MENLSDRKFLDFPQCETLQYLPTDPKLVSPTLPISHWFEKSASRTSKVPAIDVIYQRTVRTVHMIVHILKFDNA